MYHRILVPLDESKLAECAVEHVKNIAGGSPGVEVILLTVQEEIEAFTSIPFSESMAEEMVKQKEEIKNQAIIKTEKYLAAIANNLNKDGITVKTMILYPDPLKSIAEMILEYAEASKADVIVMSTHGRSGIKRWAFGSVADRVVNYSKIPILIVPPALCRV